MNKRIAVLGTGAIGSMVSADLTRAGLDITVIDQWPAQVEAMKADGLRIQLPDGTELHVPVRALHVCELASANLVFDIVLLTSKGNDHRWMSELIKPYLKSDGVLVGAQNGMNDDSIASIVGRERTVGCVLELSGEIFTPGLVQRNTAHKGTWFSVGELDGSYTPRVREIASILENVGRCDVTNNIYGAKWTKMIANTMTMGPYGLLGLKNCEVSQLPGMFDISVQIGKESFEVGRALGYRIEPVFGLRADEFVGTGEELVVTIMNTLLKHIGTRSRCAPIHDHMKGRTSEMLYIPGVVSQKGRALGIPTPANDAVLEIDRMINSGELKMDPSNFELLERRVREMTSA